MSLPTLQEAEELKKSEPSDISAKFLRISMSIRCLQEIYEQIEDNDALGKANDRIFTAFSQHFPNVDSIEELITIFDKICADLEPENGFSKNIVELYQKTSTKSREELLNNQSSSVSIIRTISAILKLNEDTGFLFLRSYYRFKKFLNALAIAIFVFSIFFSLLIPDITGRYINNHYGPSLIAIGKSFENISYFGGLLSFFWEAYVNASDLKGPYTIMLFCLLLLLFIFVLDTIDKVTLKLMKLYFKKKEK